MSNRIPRRHRGKLLAALACMALAVGAAPATATLPDVSITAAATHTQSFDWSITKSASPPSITTPNQATFGYTVTVTKGAPSNTYVVSGSITAGSPTFAYSHVGITADIVGGPACVVDDGQDLSIPAGQSVTVPYRCNVSSTESGTVRATVTWTSGQEVDQVTTATSPFEFGPAKVLNDTVDVQDAFNGAPAALLPGGDNLGSSAVFTYTRTVAAPSAGCASFPNIASIVSPDGLAREARATVDACSATATVIGTSTPPATLRVRKSGPRIATAGTTATYTIVVRNTSANPAASVVVSDLLPRGYTVLRRPAGAKYVKGKLVWSIGTLAPGASKTIKVPLRIDKSAAGTRCNTARASAGNAPSVTARACTKVLRVAGVTQVPRVTG
jgi:uncharacterized repeat protein (TIGR01451 family)